MSDDNERLGPVRRQMGRYSRSKGKFEYAWGYDRPIGEFFFQKFDTSKDDEEEETIFSIGNKITEVSHPDYPGKREFTNEEMIKIMKDEGVVPDSFIAKLK